MTKRRKPKGDCYEVQTQGGKPMTKRHFRIIKDNGLDIETPYALDIPDDCQTDDDIVEYALEAITEATGYCLTSIRLISLRPNTEELWLTRQRFADFVEVIGGDYIVGECLNKSNAWANLFNEMEAKIKLGQVSEVHKLYEGAPEDAPDYCTPNVHPDFYETQFVNVMVNNLRDYLIANRKNILGPTRYDCFDHSSERNKK